MVFSTPLSNSQIFVDPQLYFPTILSAPGSDLMSSIAHSTVIVLVNLVKFAPPSFPSFASFLIYHFSITISFSIKIKILNKQLCAHFTPLLHILVWASKLGTISDAHLLPPVLVSPFWLTSSTEIVIVVIKIRKFKI